MMHLPPSYVAVFHVTDQHGNKISDRKTMEYIEMVRNHPRPEKVNALVPRKCIWSP